MDHKRLQVVVTAYGPFGGIEDNPSDHIRKAIVEHFGEKFQVQILNQHYDILLFDSTQLAVEDDVVLAYLGSLYEKVLAHQSTHGFKDEFLLIHLGVNGGLEDLETHLERRCFNGKCFKDKNKGLRGPNTRIDPEEILDHVHRTSLPINRLYERVKVLHPFFKLNDDPGRYLCNYI